MNTIKMTNQEILNHVNNIGSIMDFRLPAKVSYALNKNRKAILEAHNCFLEEYAKLQQEYPVGGDEFEKEVEELLSVENEVPVHTVNESLLEEANHDLSLNVFIALEFMLEEQTNEQ